MMLSAICLDYGRPDHLSEALACFLSQDYHGERELVIFNSYPKIQYRFDHPNVRIVNCTVRPPNLGECRNLAIEHARGTHLIVWDSDDLFLSHYLSTIAKHFGDHQWIWQSHNFFALAWRINRIVTGSANVVCFTKAAWERVGRYKPMGTGEDRNFVSRLTVQENGTKVELSPEEIGYVYCWQNAAWHISGGGDDAPGQLTSYRRSEMELEKRAKYRRVQLGEITLIPTLKHDYDNQAKAIIGQTVKPKPQSSVGVVLLGRYGDIINFLPILRHIAESYAKPHLVIAREFLPLLDGVSYVEPYPVDLAYDQLLPAIKIAERQFKNVFVAQVWGKGWAQPKLTDAYNKESWRQSGFLNRWNDPTMLPVFDRRNLAREEALVAKLDVPGKPMLLVKLDGGVSSPCPQCPTLLGPIRAMFGGSHNIVNLSEVRAERIYDLLGLMDHAAAMVCVDTSLLHLAAASPIPYVALTNPSPWLGTSPRGNCVRKIGYADAIQQPDRVLKDIALAIQSRP